jgi:hypothetical protein
MLAELAIGHVAEVSGDDSDTKSAGAEPAATKPTATEPAATGANPAGAAVTVQEVAKP